jgi:hypothetical protein
VNSTLELQFGLLPTEAEVKSLRWSSLQTRLEASGRVTNFNNPRLELTYRLSVGLRQAGSIARVSQLQGGVMDINGRGSFSLKDFSSQGKILLRSLRWQQPGMNVEKADVSSAFNVNREQLLLSSLDGRTLGGTFKGNLELRNWLPASKAQGRAEGKPQAGVVNLRLERLDITQVAAALATKSAPFDRVNAVGVASGDVHATWTGKPQSGTAQFALAITPPAQAAPDALPITAQLETTYNGAQEILQVKNLDLATRGSRVLASGVLAPSSHLGVQLSTTNLDEFRPALAAFNVSQLPVELNGRASFKGNISGKLRSPVLTGHLEVRDFASQLRQ